MEFEVTHERSLTRSKKKVSNLLPQSSRLRVPSAVVLGISLSICSVKASEPVTVDDGQFIGEVTDRLGQDSGPSMIWYTDEHPHSDGRRAEVYWSGGYNESDDLAHPCGTNYSDPGHDSRILKSILYDGGTWSPPETLFRGQQGCGRVDIDGSVGAPSVVKIDDYTIMMMEGVATELVPLNLFYNHEIGDSMLTAGGLEGSNPQRESELQGYKLVDHLGFALTARKVGTHPIFAAYGRYANGEANNTMISTAKLPSGFRVLNYGKPVAYLYDKPAPGLKPVYSIWNGDNFDTGFKDKASDHPNLPNVELLGYAVANLSSPQAIGANQKAIYLTVSKAGGAFAPFRGLERGGAIEVAENKYTASYSAKLGRSLLSSFDSPDFLVRSKNEGVSNPSLLIRGSRFELFYTDDTVDNGRPPRTKRIVVSLSQWKKPAAWQQASRIYPRMFPTTGDVAWSELLGGYAVSHPRQYNQVSPSKPPKELTSENYADLNFCQGPSISFTKSIYRADQFLNPETHSLNPTSVSSDFEYCDVLAGHGGFARDIQGQTLDFPNGDGSTKKPYIAFHHVYPAASNRARFNSSSSFLINLRHSLSFYFK